MSEPILFVSGPMRGLPDKNHQAFEEAEEELWSYGFDAITPPWLAARHPNASFDDLILRDLHALAQCDGVYLLQGWERSQGARLEHDLARLLGKPVLFEGELP